jgi:hypothetical protein
MRSFPDAVHYTCVGDTLQHYEADFRRTYRRLTHE